MCRFGKKFGEDIFPSQREIAFRAGVSTSYVNQTVQMAEKTGWIIRNMIPYAGVRSHTLYELSIPVGVHDATSLMRKRFWLPPYKHILVEKNDSVFLMPRTTHCSS